MNIIEVIGQAAFYGGVWIAISVGITFILASAFFGVEEVEKNLEENQHDV